jgi:hypothetical protein
MLACVASPQPSRPSAVRVAGLGISLQSSSSFKLRLAALALLKSFVAASSSSSCMLQVATGTRAVTGSERARGTSSGDSESLSKFTWVRIASGLGGHDLIYYGMIVTMPGP